MKLPQNILFDLRYLNINYYLSFMSSDMVASWLPSIFVPMIGILVPAVSIVLLGRYITAAE